MGCNCGKRAHVRYSYIYTSTTGQQTSYNTEIEAKAAQVRAGGGGSIRSVPR